MAHSRDRVMRKLNEKFPNINAVPSEDFNGSPGGIWFRQEGELHKDGLPYFDYYAIIEVHNSVRRVLDQAGFHAEPHDPGTWFAWC